MVAETPIPNDCILHPRQAGANFADCFCTLVPRSNLSALDIYRAVAKRTPAWVEALMRVRNLIVQAFGLKNLGAMAHVQNGPVQPGQRLGLFEVSSISPVELVLQDNDRHLTVQLSLQKRTHTATHDAITLSTVVHTHNTLGRAYMLVVGPAHKLIVPAVLRQATAAIQRALRQSTA
jgi:Protein of unknown function (DUF2867)